MIEKMTLEQFQQIKKQLDYFSKFSENYYEAHKDDPNFDESSFEKITLNNYIEIQNQLLDYDLSDIPFEEWEGITIRSLENARLDFSKTKANIDFGIVDYWGNCNFSGCNVRNLDKLKRLLNAKDFDEETIKANPSIFLSDSFSEAFKDKYYDGIIGISDLAGLTSEQLAELEQKDYSWHLDLDFRINNGIMLDFLGLKKSVQLYNHSQEEFEVVEHLLRRHHSFGFDGKNYEDLSPFEKFLVHLKDVDASKIKDSCYDYEKQLILNSSLWFNQDDYPSLFVSENPELFLVNVNIPDEVKDRYFKKNLNIQDLIDYPDAFQSVPIDNFMNYGIYVNEFFKDNYGLGHFQKLVQEHPDVFQHLAERNGYYQFSQLLKKQDNFESSFAEGVKEYFINYDMEKTFRKYDGSQVTYDIPEWLSSMNFKFVDSLNSGDELINYDDHIVVLDNRQRKVLNTLGIDNIRKFNEETGFFSHKGYESSNGLDMFKVFNEFFQILRKPEELPKDGIDFKNGELSYDEFKTEIAKCIDLMRHNSIFGNIISYSWLQGEFRENHPELFIEEAAPEELKNVFYEGKITPAFLFEHKDYIKYLIDKNMTNTIKANMKLTVVGAIDDNGYGVPFDLDFIDNYVKRYGNEKFLRLCAKYGSLLSDISISNFDNSIEDEQKIEKKLRDALHNKIVKGSMDYSYLVSVPDFLEEHPDLFVNFDNVPNITDEEKRSLEEAFYKRSLKYDDIKKHPELIDALKDKNLFIAFGNREANLDKDRIVVDVEYGQDSTKKHDDLDLLKAYGNEKFLELCSKYGKYVNGISEYLSKEVTIKDGKYVDLNGNTNPSIGLSFEDISKRIENIITREIKLGNFSYNPEDAPDFLKVSNPELFLDEDAPEELKNYFYRVTSNYVMKFDTLSSHKEWMPYLKGKAIATSLLRNSYLKKDLIKFLELFGEEKAIKLGINRAETVNEMMKSHKVDLMKRWYDKTGGKFIPDFVIMQNFSIEDADKFLSSASNWSNLMRIGRFSRRPENRDAMLKLAYSFGAFDHDQRGFKKTLDLLTNIPRTLDEDKGYIIDRIDGQINTYSQRGVFFKNQIKRINGVPRRVVLDMTPEEKEEAYNKMIEYTKNNKFVDLFDTNTLVSLLEALKKEKTNVDFSRPIFSQIYHENEDGSYHLTINSQSCPKSVEAIRGILEKFNEMPILNPNMAHHYLGGFKLEYDPEFREFFLSNFDNIISDSKYLSQISSIQSRFQEIKTVYSNVNLTLDLAMSYLSSNKYVNVNPGNERVTKIAAIQNYSQADFEMLQQIFNYGKQRTFSSIPRVESEQLLELPSGKYNYEMLRLDDPRAMSIGFESDCCQKLNDCAEVCMEHSMVDKNGRVFIITNELGEVVAQSWVWRNKDVLCFDNIEIPDQKMWDNGVPRGYEDSGIRNQFTDDILSIYQRAAHELIERDEMVYKELLDSGKITQEQYDGLRLGKITTGLGYSNIKGSLKTLPIDKGAISRPLPFEEPVKLSRSLYTNDSNTQFIIEEREDRKEYSGDTLPVHNDSFVEYTDDTIPENSLLTLEKLESITKGDSTPLDIYINGYDSKHIVTDLANNYGLNPDTTRVVMNPNFAIIYDVNDNIVRVADLFYNTKVDNDFQQMDIENQVEMQMRLALDQISADKIVDVSNLNDNQKEMYEKVIGLTDEIDLERGVSHAK